MKLAFDPEAPRIVLKVEDADIELIRQKELIINQFGLENVQGLRNAQDGVVYFGSKRNGLDPLTKKEAILNDYIFENLQNNENGGGASSVGTI